MKTKIDIKSAIIGALLTTTLNFGVAATTEEDDQIGRYQVGISDHYVVLFDTTSGQMWRETPSRINKIETLKTNNKRFRRLTVDRSMILSPMPWTDAAPPLETPPWRLEAAPVLGPFLFTASSALDNVAT